MTSSIYSKKRLFLLILLLVFVLQAVVIVLQRRDVYFSRDVSEGFISQKTTVGGRILNFLRTFLQEKNERVDWRESSQNNTQAFDSSKGNNRVKVKMKSFKDIEKSNSNIFFIESRCGTRKSTQMLELNSNFNLKPRQCCSVESAAMMNPTRNVYILHTCPLGQDFDLHLPAHARDLLRLDNVFVVPLSMEEALDGTPVTSLYRGGKLENSLYPIVHASDILRLVVLWRFGGTYCDMDILFIRPLSELSSNFCGLESHKNIGNSILNFEPTGYGHDILTKILVQVNTRFNGQVWAANGPDLLTNTILQECKATIETVSQCSVFRVYNQTVLYPLLWKNHMDIFDASRGAEVVKSIKDTGFTVHFWNKFTAHHNVHVGSSQAYGLLADEFCPAVYRNCGETF